MIKQIIGSNFPFTDVFLFEKKYLFVFLDSTMLTGAGFLAPLIPSLLGFIILGRRLSGLAKVEPLTARIDKDSLE
jgi:hypothetical protein